MRVDTGDPAIVRLPRRKPLRPVVLRPHLSAGLPLNSSSTMRRMPTFCKEVSLSDGGRLHSAHQKQRLGVLDALRGAAYHHHIPFLEQGIRAGFAPDDAV